MHLPVKHSNSLLEYMEKPCPAGQGGCGQNQFQGALGPSSSAGPGAAGAAASTVGFTTGAAG